MTYFVSNRGEDVVLGGVRHTNDFSTEVREEDKQGILDRCALLIPSVKVHVHIFYFLCNVKECVSTLQDIPQ